MKKCSNKACSQINPQSLDNFYNCMANNDSLHRWCKICCKESKKSENYKLSQKKYNEALNKNPIRKKYMRDHNRNNGLKRWYGITLEQYNLIFNQQNGCCAICDQHQSNFKRALAVDHSHTTGEVRGLLCSLCNNAIGLLKEDINRLEKAKIYLNKTKLKLVGS